MPYFINLIFFLKTRKAAFKKADKIFLFVIFFACAKKMTKRNTLLSLFTQRKEAKKGNDCITLLNYHARFSPKTVLRHFCSLRSPLSCSHLHWAEFQMSRLAFYEKTNQFRNSITDKIRSFMRRNPAAAFDRTHFFDSFLVTRQEMNKFI